MSRPIVIINPGAGPVAESSEANAIACALQMLRDLAEFHTRGDGLNIPGLPPSTPDPIVTGAAFNRAPDRDEEGRYGFVFRCGEYSATVDIPGLPVDRVRWVKDPGQDIWDYPRLYINDSSFVWFYVISILRRELAGVME